MEELHIYTTPDETIKGLADFFVQSVNNAVTAKGICTVALSGGNSPKKLYELLTAPFYKQKIDWNKIYFFFGDERNVPFEDKDNNGSMAKQALFDPLQIEESKIAYIDTSLSPADAAASYEKKILSYFGCRPVRFDFILLGLGDNSHTASLFPHTDVLDEKQSLVSAVFIKELNAYRITLTAPFINASHTIVFLVYGETKAEAVFNVLKKEKNTNDYPAQLIEKKEGIIHWFLDNAAANILLR